MQPALAATPSMKLPVAEQIFGHNKAPLDVVLKADFEALQGKVDRLLARADGLPKRIVSDDDLVPLGNFIVDARKVWRDVDECRSAENAPLLEAQRGINAHFKGLLDSITKTSTALQRLSDDWQTKKAAEERAKRIRDAAEQRRIEDEQRTKAEAAKTPQAAAKAEGRADAAQLKAERSEQAADGKVADMVRTTSGGVTSTAKSVWEFRITDYPAIDLNALRHFIPRADVEKAIASMVRIQKGETKIEGVEVFEKIKSQFRA